LAAIDRQKSREETEPLADNQHAENVRAETLSRSIKSHTDASSHGGTSARDVVKVSIPVVAEVKRHPLVVGLRHFSNRAPQKIPGRRYNSDTKTSSYPISSLPEVVAFAENTGLREANNGHSTCDPQQRIHTHQMVSSCWLLVRGPNDRMARARPLSSSAQQP
jgi:hypothetical protein